MRWFLALVLLIGLIMLLFGTQVSEGFRDGGATWNKGQRTEPRKGGVLGDWNGAWSGNGDSGVWRGGDGVSGWAGYGGPFNWYGYYAVALDKSLLCHVDSDCKKGLCNKHNGFCEDGLNNGLESALGNGGIGITGGELT